MTDYKPEYEIKILNNLSIILATHICLCNPFSYTIYIHNVFISRAFITIWQLLSPSKVPWC
jgi:hypothetical protein